MKNIDLSFRPQTYWPESHTPEQLLFRIQGRVRQNLARKMYEEYGFRGLNEFLAREQLTDTARDAWGALAPCCMAGEYLPALLVGEVEIAQISLASTTGDQIGVRAHKEEGLIRYRVVGEYEDSMQYKLPFDTSQLPMSLGELMEFLEKVGLEGDVYGYGVFSASWRMVHEYNSKPEAIINFITVSSPFYAEIQPCYEVMARNWIAENVEIHDFDKETNGE